MIVLRAAAVSAAARHCASFLNFMLPLPLCKQKSRPSQRKEEYAVGASWNTEINKQMHYRKHWIKHITGNDMNFFSKAMEKNTKRKVGDGVGILYTSLIITLCVYLRFFYYIWFSHCWIYCVPSNTLWNYLCSVI